MKQRKDGIYEIEADVLADTKSSNIGDGEQQGKTIVIRPEPLHDDDPYWNRWCDFEPTFIITMP